jgi:hypothetical protein
MNEVAACCLLPLFGLSDPMMKLLPAICCRCLLLSDPEGTLTISNIFALLDSVTFTVVGIPLPHTLTVGCPLPMRWG